MKTEQPEKVELVFTCTDCDFETKDSLFNSVFDGAPLCIHCDTLMEIDKVEIKDD